MAVDDDLQLGDPGGPGAGQADLGARLFAGAGDCQNTASRPRAVVKTSWERFSRNRVATMSIAAPLRVHELSGIRSTMSGWAGHSCAGTG